MRLGYSFLCVRSSTALLVSLGLAVVHRPGWNGMAWLTSSSSSQAKNHSTWSEENESTIIISSPPPPPLLLLYTFLLYTCLLPRFRPALPSPLRQATQPPSPFNFFFFAASRCHSGTGFILSWRAGWQGRAEPLSGPHYFRAVKVYIAQLSRWHIYFAFFLATNSPSPLLGFVFFVFRVSSPGCWLAGWLMA